MMRKNLNELLTGFASDNIEKSVYIQEITQDSRQVVPGGLFLAFPGMLADGRDYVAKAIEKGAVAVLFESSHGFQAPETWRHANIPLIGISDLAGKVSLLAARFYDDPSKKMSVIGVTGTNGKTSVSQFFAQALAAYQQKCAVIGTLGKGFLPDLQSTGYTTPDAIGVQQALAECLAQGAGSVAMEVSSHSLDQARVAAVDFDLAILTNLTQDHLDYHQTMEAYGAAKAKLFQFASLKNAVYNADDEFGLKLLAQNPSHIQAWAYATQKPDSEKYPTVFAEKIDLSSQGVVIDLQTPWGKAQLHSSLLGRFNVSNLLAVLTALGALNFPLDEMIPVLERLRPVTGRMQTFGGDAGKPLVIVDYAHTPDALLQVLRCLAEHHPEKIWCVFGCGGDRDKSKRPQMGAIAAKYSDHIIITNDNPRSEDPGLIAQEIRKGIPANFSVDIQLDRAAAIAQAIQAAGPKDIVLIAGKGHETEQIIGKKVLIFSDINIVQSCL